MMFCDTDGLVQERTGKDIRTLVAEYGWDRFREEEHKAVETLARLDDQVIAMGGGAILDRENVRNLMAQGRTPDSGKADEGRAGKRHDQTFSERCGSCGGGQHGP